MQMSAIGVACFPFEQQQQQSIYAAAGHSDVMIQNAAPRENLISAALVVDDNDVNPAL
jgi:hypothetical protein